MAERERPGFKIADPKDPKNSSVNDGKSKEPEKDEQK